MCGTGLHRSDAFLYVSLTTMMLAGGFIPQGSGLEGTTQKGLESARQPLSPGFEISSGCEVQAGLELTVFHPPTSVSRVLG